MKGQAACRSAADVIERAGLVDLHPDGMRSMTARTAYADLLAHFKQAKALELASGLLSWDQEVMMPSGGAEQRAEQAGAMQAVLHAKRTDPRIGDWLDAIDTTALTSAGQANVRLIRRKYDRTRRVPQRLAEELARVTSKAQGIWAEARKARDMSVFAPELTRIVDLVRDYADVVREDGQTLYDAVLQDYEPGGTEAEIATTFDRLRAGLTVLRERIAEKVKAPPRLEGTFPEAAQMALAHELADAFGYDTRSGRLDLSTHPFTNGTRGDCRITTRVATDTPFDCLYSTIHEVGHALYEQGLDPELQWQPAGDAVSMGVHESQSRYCENQIGRSEAFAEYLFPKLTDAFGNIGLSGPRDFYRAANRVEPGFIRTEADEIHYNLHIMLRFDLERALISRDLDVASLEAAWNDRFRADFGVDVPDSSLGVLQDVHWSCGLFGYFPTYALGNVYSGCLAQALRRDVNDMDALMRTGNLSPLIDWMRAHVHNKGSLNPSRETVALAAGQDPDEKPLLAYLEAKFTDLYDL